jgi:hypothetical protein
MYMYISNKYSQGTRTGEVLQGRLVVTVLTLNLLTTTIFAPPSNASKWQMGFNSAFKGLMAPFQWPQRASEQCRPKRDG